MAKKAKTSRGVKRFVDLWPGTFTWTHALISLSVMLNLAVLAFLILLMKSDPFQDVYLEKGVRIMCSEEYINKQSTEVKASLTYRCASGEAHDFYLKGYNDYRTSLGLTPVN